MLITIWILFIFLIFYHMKKTKCVPSNATITLSQAKSLKGIAAIEIVMGHLGIATHSVILYPNRKAGILFVGVFFFLSGYGLMTNLIKRHDYLKGFLLKRLVLILGPAYFIYFLMLILTATLGLSGPYQGIFHLLFQGFWQSTNWFVFELLGLYLLFFVLFRWLDRNKALIILTLLSILFIMIAFYTKMENPWYGSTLCFSLGLFYAINRQKINSFLYQSQHLYAVISLTLIGSSIAAFYLLGDTSIIGNVIARNAASVLFSIFLMIVLLKFQISNAVSLFLGEFSYEIFLIHPCVLSIMKNYVSNTFLYVFLCLTATIVLAYLIHFPVKWISFILLRKRTR